MRLPLFSRVRRAFLVARSDSRSTRFLQEACGQGPRRWIARVVLCVAGSAATVASAQRQESSPIAEDGAHYDSAWSGDAAPMWISGAFGVEGSVADGFPLVGRYEFFDGRLYGCYDPERRVLEGVWTQTGAAATCERAAGGAIVWGRFEFAFSPDGRRFEGSWSSCEQISDSWWNGVLSPTPAQAPDLRDPLAVLDALPPCRGATS